MKLSVQRPGHPVYFCAEIAPLSHGAEPTVCHMGEYVATLLLGAESLVNERKSAVVWPSTPLVF